MANREYSLQELTSRAETYCARAEHCASEVRMKILAWGGTPAQADSVIDHLYEQGYLDDARYCRAYTHDKLLYQHWGKVKIRAMLQARQLPSTAIQSALQNIDETEYNRILLTVLSTKKNAPREVQIRFLLQRGFEYTSISRVVRDF
ncbi:MAG: regulatory protein RecX [Paludibacteraceae bacterium]|nr:regulatory protein RecX [Paludibacteraceae bacterium]